MNLTYDFSFKTIGKDKCYHYFRWNVGGRIFILAPHAEFCEDAQYFSGLQYIIFKEQCNFYTL